MINHHTYSERVSSNRTEALFLVLTLLFLVLVLWRVNVRGLDVLTAVCFGLFIFFLFYALNYRTLIIQLTLDCLNCGLGCSPGR